MNFNFLETQRRLIADTKDGLSADEIYKRSNEVEDLQSKIKDLGIEIGLLEKPTFSSYVELKEKEKE